METMAPPVKHTIPKKPKTRMAPKDDFQREHFERHGWTRKTVFDAAPASWRGTQEERAKRSTGMNELKNRLLDLGGWGVCLPAYEEDLQKILGRGRTMAGRPDMMRGEPSQCHRNAAACYEANRGKVLIATGYALSKDGVWRQHSWIVAGREDEPGGIVETTEKRVGYHGFVMTTDECESFLEENA